MSTGGSYVPPPSTGHEIGVMFGFIGAMIVAMALYVVWWQIDNKKSLKREDDRVRALRAQGVVPMEEKIGSEKRGAA